MTNIPTTGLLSNEGAGDTVGGGLPLSQIASFGAGVLGSLKSGSPVDIVGGLNPALAVFTKFGQFMDSKLGGQSNRDIPIPGLSIKTSSNPIIQAAALNIKPTLLNEYREGAKLLKERQDAIDFGINETKRRLGLLGEAGSELLNRLNSDLTQINSQISGLGPAEVLVSGAQQLMIDSLSSAEDLISQMFDEAETNGLAPETRHEFNRQSEKVFFDEHRKLATDFISNRRNTELQGLERDGRYNKDTPVEDRPWSALGGNANTIDRLGDFFNENYQIPQEVLNKRGAEIGTFLDKSKGRQYVFQKPDTWGGEPGVYYPYGQKPVQFNDMDRFGHPTGNVSRINTPITDITPFLTSFNPPQPPAGDGTGGQGQDTPQNPDADPNDPYPQDPGGTGDGGDVPGDPYDPSTDYPPDTDLDIPPVVVPPIPDGDSGGDTDSGNNNNQDTPDPDIDFEIPQFTGAVLSGGGGGESVTPLRQVPISGGPVVGSVLNLEQPSMPQYRAKGFDVQTPGILQEFTGNNRTGILQKGGRV